MAPAGTPDSIIVKLYEVAAQAIQKPAVTEKFMALGMEPVGSSPAAFAAAIKAETPVWQNLIKKVGIKPIE